MLGLAGAHKGVGALGPMGTSIDRSYGGKAMAFVDRVGNPHQAEDGSSEASKE